MALVALVTWLATAGGGLYLLAIWLIEYDRDYQTTAATRLPVPVIGSHALLALAGLFVWGAYLLVDDHVLAWVAVAILGCVATLGVIMAVRWFRSYRTSRAGPGAPAAPARQGWPAASSGVATAPAVTGHRAVAPERNFPLPVVIAHGLLALVTITLVVLTALRT